MHAAHGDKIINQTGEHRVDVPLVPKVPSIGRSAGRHDDALRWSIETNLVFPLLVINRGRRTPATVHRNPQAPLTFWREVKFLFQPAERLVAEFEFLRGDLGPALFLELARPLSGDRRNGRFRLTARQALRGRQGQAS